MRHCEFYKVIINTATVTVSFHNVTKVTYCYRSALKRPILNKNIIIIFSAFSEIPEKQLREWKELLLRGLPFFVEQQPEQEPSAELVELEKQDILNNQDYDEYTVSGCLCLYLLQPLEALRK